MNSQSGIEMRLGLVETIRHWSKYLPNKPALLYDEKVITYGDLYRDSMKTAAEISRIVPLGGEPVGLLTEGKSTFLTGLLAILASGNSTVILNPVWPNSVLAEALNDSGATNILIDTKGVWKRLESQHSAARPLMIGDGQASEGAENAISFSPRIRDAGATWGIIYSSGTTSQPKGIVRTDFSILMELLGWCLELPIARQDTFYIGRPLFYTGGLVLTASTLLVGGTVCVSEEHKLERFHCLQENRQLTQAFFLPDQVREMVRYYEVNSLPKYPVSRIITMGAPIASDEKLRATAVLKSEFIESWGNSEGLGTITDSSDLKSRPTSVGRPFLCDEMLICNDDGSEVATGAVGRIAGYADSRLTGYRNREDLNSTLILGDLVLSEDLGRIDKDGYFYLCGRMTERIMRKGNPVFLNEILPIVRSLPGIVDAAVIGITDPTDGEVPVAAVSMVPGCTNSPNALMELANTKLPPLHHLKNIKIVQQLPKTATGKISIEGVRKLFAECPTVENIVDKGE
jgi:acyl-CoA synthetase (AMP-forming)/AMP-acid ligase II